MSLGSPFLSLGPERGWVQIHIVWPPSAGPYILAYITRHFAGSIGDHMCRISGIIILWGKKNPFF